MKGPAVFFVSLAAVAGIAAGVLLPVWREKQALLKERAEGASTSEPAARARSEGDLLRAFDPPPDRWREAVENRIPALAARAGADPDDCRPEAGRMTFRLPASGLPALLAGLADAPVPPIDVLTVTGGEGEDSYRVEISFLLTPTAPGGR